MKAQKNVIFLLQNIIIFCERLKCVVVFMVQKNLYHAKYIFLFNGKNFLSN